MHTAASGPAVDCTPPRMVDGVDVVLALQRQAGNTVVSRMMAAQPTSATSVQRTPLVVQRNGPSTKIAQLDSWLDAWDTPEGRVIDLLGTMSSTEKATVVAGYRDRLANCLNFGEMKRALANLGAILPVRLDWLEKAALLGATGIGYGEIQPLVRGAPQSERDMLNNGRWKTYFQRVCTNTTIIPAVGDLKFDLATQLDWVKGEAVPLFLPGGALHGLVTAAPQPQRDAVATEAWRPFWSSVCNNATMATLVDLLFPTDLVRKLVWMLDEGTDIGTAHSKVTATTDAAQRLLVLDNTTVRNGITSIGNPGQVVSFVLDCGGTWARWKPWVQRKGSGHLVELALAALGKGLLTPSPIVTGFLNVAGMRSAAAARGYIRGLSDANLAVLRAHETTADVISDTFAGGADPVIRALQGEISSGEQTVSNSETLLTGPTTSPFVARDFGGDHRFRIAYWRDRVVVDVAVKLEAKDARARELLPTATATWRSNIEGAWDNKFQITNGQRTIPMRFRANLGSSGPNHVNVHSGRWAWPNLNAGNWFVPDPVNVPDQADAVARAPIHEFGHLIGNLDEYSVGAAHYVAVTGSAPAASTASTTVETDTAGTSRYTNTLSVMGTGTTILQRHVNNILAWVNTNLRSGEPPFTFVP